MISELQLELTNRCNSNCIMCHRELNQRKIGDIELSEAKRIIDESVRCGAKFIKPQWYGESTLYKQYLEVLKYSKDKGMKIMVFTNGSALTEEMIDKMLEIGVDKVVFSIDSQIKEEYEQIRKGLLFEKVLENLKYFDIQSRMLWKYPHKTEIIVAAVDQGKNNHDLIEFFRPYTDSTVIAKNIRVDQVKSKVKVYCNHNVEKRLIVDINSDCYLCCRDWYGAHYIGNLKKQSIEDVWNGELRQNLLKNLNNLELCQKCMQ